MTANEFITYSCKCLGISEQEFSIAFQIRRCLCGEPMCLGWKYLAYTADDLQQQERQLRDAGEGL